MNRIALWIDLAFCLLFLPLMLLVFPVERWWGTYPRFFLLLVAWLYATYFIYRYFVIPRLCRTGLRSRVIAGAVVVASLAVTFAFASYNITSPFYHLRQQVYDEYTFPVWGVRQNQQAVWLHYILVVAFCAVVGTLTEAYRQRLARREVELARNKAELALYKSQINPHFLFNTLNTLYGLVITRNDKAESAMERFITLTKYLYNNAGRDWIPISEEVDYIEQYIELQKLRLSACAAVSFDHAVEHSELQLPPMLLITFVENAFKHGISSEEECFVNITLNQTANCLQFEVVNSVFDRGHADSMRTGIDNCRKRLALLYPARHSLSCERREHDFRVQLTIDL